MPDIVSRSLKVAILGIAVFAGGCDRQSGDKAQPQASQSVSATANGATSPQAPVQGVIDRSHKGSQMPDFSFTDPAGQSLRLASLKGKPLLINLWATWCAPCVTEMPMLDKLAKDRAGTLNVLTVSQDMGQPEKVAAFFKERGFALLKPWLDPENNLAFHYNTGTLPTTIYYDAQGREVWRFVGGHDWGNAETARMLAEAEAR